MYSCFCFKLLLWRAFFIIILDKNPTNHKEKYLINYNRNNSCESDVNHGDYLLH